MKKPSKEIQEITKECEFLEEYKEYTPEDFRLLADNMDENGVIAFKFWTDGVAIEQRKKQMETEAEAKQRFRLQNRLYENHKEQEKKLALKRIHNLKKEAPKLGFKLV
jgi:hypothetical protein